MKQIQAIVQPHLVNKVMSALHSLDHYPGITLIDVHGQGRGSGAGMAFQMTEQEIDFKKKVLLLIFSSDDRALQIAETIRISAHTGNPGDGIIVISDAEMVIRIRTGEINEEAL